MRLEQMIAGLRNLQTFDERCAELAAPKMEEAAKAQASAGIDPNGRAWTPKKDGSRPLENAADHVRAEVHGNRVDLIVDGPEYFHQTAKAGGRLPQRKIIPSVGDPLPPALKQAADEAVAQALQETRTR